MDVRRKTLTMKPEFKCICVDVEIGSYDNQITVEIPQHMHAYRVARNEAGLSGLVSIDRCVFPIVEYVWSHGVKTDGSCCGHGEGPPRNPFISVQSTADIQIMHTLGFRELARVGARVNEFLVREVNDVQP